MKSFILVLLSLVFGVTWSQNTITGKIVTENKQPVQAAIISLLDVKTNGFIKGELSNEISFNNPSHGTAACTNS